MKAFLDTFCIGSPDAPASWLSLAMAFLEQNFYITGNHQHDWRQILGYTEEFKGDKKIYILQADELETPPPSWLVFAVTRKQGETINGLLKSLGHCRTQSLLNDLHHDTYESVRHLDETKVIIMINCQVVSSSEAFC
jgi:hypothetical protein